MVQKSLEKRTSPLLERPPKIDGMKHVIGREGVPGWRDRFDIGARGGERWNKLRHLMTVEVENQQQAIQFVKIIFAG
jgi:hypothetical protein